MAFTKKGVALLAVALTLACVSCGNPIPPLQSPVTVPPPTEAPTTAPQPTLPPATVVLQPSSTAIETALPTGTSTQTPTPSLTPTPGPSPTPDIEKTSAAVFATITAMAATPTYPPTSTPRPQRTPIGAGPDDGDIPPTALYSANGIAVLTLSKQVAPGGAAALTIKTSPSATCAVLVSRGAGSQARLESIPGASSRIAGRDGVAAWIWNVDAQEPAGIMTLVVDCGKAGKITLQMKITQ